MCDTVVELSLARGSLESTPEPEGVAILLRLEILLACIRNGRVIEMGVFLDVVSDSSSLI